MQEALLDVARGIGGYRWEASFLSWAYAICARRVARHARADAIRLRAMSEWTRSSLRGPAEVFEPHEAILIAQDAHLACALVVADRLGPALRTAYLVGDVLGVNHHLGARLCGCSEDAFRRRLSRARRAVRLEIHDAMREVPVDDGHLQRTAHELDRLVRLGELARARSAPLETGAVARALRIAAPSLVDGQPR